MNKFFRTDIINPVRSSDGKKKVMERRIGWMAVKTPALKRFILVYIHVVITRYNPFNFGKCLIN